MNLGESPAQQYTLKLNLKQNLDHLPMQFLKFSCFSRRCKKASTALPIINAKSFYIVVIDCPSIRSLMHSK